MNINPLDHISEIQQYMEPKENKKTHPLTKKSQEILKESYSYSKKLSKQVVSRAKNLKLNDNISLEVSDVLQIKKIAKVEKTIRDKNAGYWKCIDSKLDEASGGYQYKFEVRPEYGTKFSEERRKFYVFLKHTMFPAIQRDPEQLQLLIEDSPFLQAVGFECSEFSEDRWIVVPDTRILNYRWNQLREKDPALPKFEFMKSYGTVSDRSFVETFRMGKVPVSMCEEFIHDLSIHVVAVILLVENSRELSLQLMNLFHMCVDKLNEALLSLEQTSDLATELNAQRNKQYCKMLWTGLSMLIDNFTAQQTYLGLYSVLINLPNFLELEWKANNDDPWFFYMQKRYGAAFEINQENLQKMWKYLVENAVLPTKSTFNAESAWLMINDELNLS